MPTYTMLPDGNWGAYVGVYATTGAASAWQAISDSSDASFFHKTSTYAGDRVAFTLSHVAIPSTEYIVSIALNIRLAIPAGGLIYLELPIGGAAPGSYAWTHPVWSIAGLHTIQTITLPVLTATNRNFTQADLDAMVLYINDRDLGGTLNIYDASVTVTTNTRPVVTVTTPTGTVSDTTTPLVQWTYTDAEGDAASLYDVKVYASSVYSAAGFNPETDLGYVARSTGTGAPSGAYCTPAMTGSGTFRAYVKVGGYNGPYAIWSDWNFSGFTLSLSPPALPVVAGGYVTAGQYAGLTVAGHTNMLSADDASLETTIGDWIADTNCTVSRSATQAMSGADSLRLSSTAGGTMTAVIANTTAGREPINFQQGYTAMASFRAGASARTCRVGIRWLNSATATISTSYSPTITSSTSAWTTAAYLFTPPANAAFACVVVEVQSTAGAAELHYVDEMALYPGTVSGFTNMCTNPSVEVDLTGWAKFFGDPNITMTQDNARAFHGTQSIRCDMIGSASSGTFGQSVYNLVTGVTYTASVYVWNDTVNFVPSLNIAFPFIQPGSSTTAHAGAWVRLTVTWVQQASSANQAFITVQATGALTAGMKFWADAMQVEVGSSATAFNIPSPTWTPGGYGSFTAVLERSNDGGNTYLPVYGSPFTLDPLTQTVAVSDYEPVRGPVGGAGSVQYRCREFAVNSANGLVISSDYISPLILPTSNDGQWWIKSLAAPALNLGGARVQADVPFTRPEEQGVFRPLGNANAVVVHGDLHGEDGSLTVIAVNAAEQAIVEALVERQDSLVLQDPLGNTKRIQWTKRDRSLGGTLTQARHTYSLDYVQVD